MRIRQHVVRGQSHSQNDSVFDQYGYVFVGWADGLTLWAQDQVGRRYAIQKRATFETVGVGAAVVPVGLEGLFHANQRGLETGHDIDYGAVPPLGLRWLGHDVLVTVSAFWTFQIERWQ